MKKLFFAILLAGLAIMLASWVFADNQGSSTTAKSGTPVLKTGTSPAADPSQDKSLQEAIRAEKAAEENARLESEREKQVQEQPEALKYEESNVSTSESPAQAEPAKWQPIYEQGKLVNEQHSLQIKEDKFGPEPGMTTAIIFSEDFETAWDTTGVDHPLNWVNNDNGNAGSKFWSVDDWHKYYYSTWTSNSARINYYPNAETTYNEWLITPAVALTSGATACSLTWRNYYYHRTANDSAFVKISTDDGATWVDSLRWGVTQASGYKKLDLTSYAGQTVKVAFVYRAYANPYTSSYYWYIDDVKFFADGATLLNENFETWGPGGNLPPTGWAILDSGAVKNSGGYNNNDWFRYANSSWTGNCARVYYVSSSPYDPEYQNEELVTPAISIAAGAVCTLSVVEYYYHSTTTPFEGQDHGYILLSTNSGATWPETLANHTSTIGLSSSKSAFKYDLTSHAGQSIMLKFQFVNSPIGYSYWQIDDVSVNEIILPDHDIATSQFVSPTSVMIQGYSWPISTRYTNIGTNTESFTGYQTMYGTVITPFFTEAFTSGIPGTWTVIDSLSDTFTWLSSADHNTRWPTELRDSSNFTGGYVIVDMDAGGSSGPDLSEQLLTPWINCTGQTNVFLSFSNYFYGSTSYPDQWGKVEIRTSDGGSWTRIDSFNTTLVSGQLQYDIHGLADNEDSVQIRFWYRSTSWSWYWSLDNVVLGSGANTTIYTDSQPVTNLTSLSSTNLAFNNYTVTAAPGTYTKKTYHNLATDSNNANDTLIGSVNVYAHTGTGGPDAGYYSWADNINGGGPAMAWRDISSIGTPVTFALGSGDDRYTTGIDLGFGFYFYGGVRTRIFISEDGIVCFDSLTSSYATNATIPSTSSPNNIVAVLWDDINMGADASAYYYTNNVDTFIVSYINFKWYATADSANRFTAQVILTGSDNKVKVQYQSVGPVVPTNHTIGIEGSGAAGQGLLYYYNNSPVGNLALPGLAITYTYNPPAHDMAATTLLAPTGNIVNGANFTPRTIFTNLGGIAETSVPVYFDIYDSTGTLVYNDNQTIASIAPASIDTVDFTTTSISVNGNYRCTTYVVLPLDTYPNNDKLTGTFKVDQHFGTGGPDAEYYYWIDNTEVGGPTFSWVDMSAATVCTLTSYDTGVSTGKALGGTFHYYGTDYDSVKIGANSVLSLLMSTTSLPDANTILPTAATPNAVLAGCWDDMNNRVGSITYLSDIANDRFIVQYDSIVFYGSSISFDLQIILDWSDNTITYQYDNIVGTLQTDYTIGIENATGTSGLSYIFDNNKPLNAMTNDLAIKFYQVLPTHDIAARQFLAPTPVGTLNVPVTPQVVFANGGLNDEATVPVRLIITPGVYNNTQSAVIDSGTMDTVSFASFTPTSGGVYTLTAIAELGTDVNPTNDTLEFTFTVFDTVLDFEANNGGLLASGSWGAFLGDWEWGTPSVVGPTTTPSGTNCWATIIDGNRTSGYSLGGIRSWLDFQIDAGTGNDAMFGFTEWYKASASTYDSLNVLVDDGSGWVRLSSKNGVDTTWKTVSYDLSLYTGVIDVRLEYYSNSSIANPGWYIDDLAFTNCSPYYPAHEMATQAILAPAGVGAINEAVTPRVIFKNNSTSTETSVPVSVTITPGTYNNSQSITSIGSLEIDTISFANFTPTATGTYTVTAIVSLGTDVDNSNDTLVGTFEVYDQVVDFESSNGGFQTGGGPDWEYGTPTYASGPATAYSGVNCWGTNLEGLYTASVVSDLLFDLQVGDTSTGGQALWAFYHWYYYESSYDGGEVRVSTDNGATWTLLYPLTGYTGYQNTTNPLPGQDSIYSGSTHNYWHPAEFDLSAYSNQIIGIKMSSGADGSGQYPGWYIDDFAFLNCGLYLPAHDVEVASITSPYNQLQGGQTYSITATVRNKGANAETFTVKATDNHGFTNTQTVTALPSLSQTTVTFPGWAITNCYSYDLAVITQLGTDVNNTNDTLQKGYDAVDVTAYNFVGYDSPGIENATLFYSPSNIWAAQFDVTAPATGALIEAVEFKFLTIGDPFWPWPDAVHDPIQGFIFIDSDNNGIPDATPLLVDTLYSADSGWTVWPIDCVEALRACNSSKFWAGVSAAETLHYEGLAMDSVLDYRDLYWKRVSGAWVIDSAATGDKMIRASYDTSSTGTVTIAIGSLSVTGSAENPASDTVVNTIDNTGNLCDMFYSATVIEDTPFRPRHGDIGDVQHNPISQAPLGYATTSDAKGTHTEPYYPPHLYRTGSDAFGYRYIDSDEVGGPTYSWVDISTVGTPVVWDSCGSSFPCVDQGFTFLIPMGMSFQLYGNTYDSVSISSNGFLSFQRLTSWYDGNSAIPTASVPNAIIAPMWDDLKGDTTLGNVFYYHDTANNRFIVTWQTWNWYANPQSDTFSMQVILNGNGDILMQYGGGLYPSTDLSYTIGLESGDGSAGLQVYYSETTPYIHGGMAILFDMPIHWLSTDLTSGTLDPAAPAMPFNIFMNSAELDSGTYLGRIIVTSNDLANPSVTINVSFTVTGGGGGDCEYIIGDISGDGNRMGGDVTYGVRYFKGIGTRPPDSCFMDSTGTYMYVAGDCNGNCEFRGSDITRLVAYFKGLAALSCCHWFPTTLPLSILNIPTQIQQTNPGTAVIPRNDDKAIIGTHKTTE